MRPQRHVEIDHLDFIQMPAMVEKEAASLMRDSTSFTQRSAMTTTRHNGKKSHRTEKKATRLLTFENAAESNKQMAVFYGNLNTHTRTRTHTHIQSLQQQSSRIHKSSPTSFFDTASERKDVLLLLEVREGEGKKKSFFRF